MADNDQMLEISISDSSLEEICKIEEGGEEGKEQEVKVEKREEMRRSVGVLRRIVPKIFDKELMNLLQRIIMGKGNNDTKRKTKKSCIKEEEQAGKEQFQSNSQQPKDQQQNCQIQNNETMKKIKRIIAKVFCEKGYGLDLLRNQLYLQQIQIPLQKIQYNKLLSEIVLQVFRKLQDFLYKMGYIQTLTTSKPEIIIVKDIGINCRTLFPSSVSSSFFSTIKCMFEIEPYDAVTLEQSCELYSKFKGNIIRLVQNKKQINPEITNSMNIALNKILNESLRANQNKEGELSKGKEDKFELHNQWKEEYEKILIELYKKNQKMTNISRELIQKYPEEWQLFTGQFLRGKLCKIIRAALKKLLSLFQKHSKTHNLPNLPKLDDNRLRMIVYHHKAKEVRFQILQIYEKQFNPNLLHKVVTSINNYIQAEERASKVKSQKKQAPPPLYHPKFANGKKKYGKYNGTYDPNKVKMKFRAGQEYAQRNDQDQEEKRDCHSDNQSVYSIF